MAKEIEQNMNGVKMGHNKLRANIAKFVVENIGLGDFKLPGKNVREKTQMAYHMKGTISLRQVRCSLYEEV
ncbi:hypothetical protein Hanom_Chr04g00316301 [Helianthus anomalus]